MKRSHVIKLVKTFPSSCSSNQILLSFRCLRAATFFCPSRRFYDRVFKVQNERGLTVRQLWLVYQAPLLPKYQSISTQPHVISSTSRLSPPLSPRGVSWARMEDEVVKLLLVGDPKCGKTYFLSSVAINLWLYHCGCRMLTLQAGE